ncbi:MAG: segregation and condensation protein A [Nitrospinaceae bacterium]|nr:MAG: segregation and condensation protein A [Nitrospinaceae bacterium]
MAYQCKIDIFEGPLDLLLHLIKEQKMDIHDIPIKEITRQYMDTLDLMQDLNLEIAGEYLVMAAELTRVKSKFLLPVQEQDGEEGEEGQDPRADLMRRLLEYQRYKDAAFELRVREHDRQQVFVRGGNVSLNQGAGEETLVEATAFDLLNAFQNILKSKEFKKDYEIKITTFSVADRLSHILEILNAAETVTFDSLFTVLNTRQEVIVTFLALLELMRLKLLRVQQVDQLDPIRIYRSTDRETQDEILQQYHSQNPEESSF